MAKRGRFLGIPYDWRRPTAARFRRTLWNRDERRFFVPKAYGWGYDINFGAFFPRRNARSMFHVKRRSSGSDRSRR